MNIILKYIHSDKFKQIVLILYKYILISIIYGFYIVIYENQSVLNTIYYLITTSTTVGYGDISPITKIGKILSIIYMIISISTLGLLLGVIGEGILNSSEKRKKGLLKMKKYIKLLIIGYPTEDKIKELIIELRKDENFKNEIIVCLDNNLKEKPIWFNDYNIHFIKGLSSDIEILNKTNIKKCKIVLILANNPNDIISDDFSSSTATVIQELNPNLRMIIEHVRKDNILFNLIKNKTLTQITNANVLAQEILDQGAIELQESIFSNKTSGTQYNIIYKGEKKKWKEIAIQLINLDAIPEGFKNPNKKSFNLMPDNENIVLKNAIIKYRAIKRLKQLI